MQIKRVCGPFCTLHVHSRHRFFGGLSLFLYLAESAGWLAESLRFADQTILLNTALGACPCCRVISAHTWSPTRKVLGKRRSYGRRYPLRPRCVPERFPARWVTPAE